MTIPGELASPPQAQVDAPPDWATIEREILCPLCDYNLRGLIEPRCPECGHRFTWPEAFAQERVHRYLFEHHPERNVKSFLQTLAGSVLPWRLWRTLLPTHMPVVGRMIVYWLVLLILLLLVATAAATVMTMQTQANMRALRQQYVSLISNSPSYPIQSIIARYGSVQAYVNATYRIPPASTTAWQVVWLVVPLIGTLIVWPWLTLLSLMVFRASMLQARVKPGHVLRTVIYSSDVMLICAAVLLAAHCIPLDVPVLSGIADLNPLFCMLGALVLILRLAVAYVKYLRFPHAVWTVLASQIMVALAMFKIHMMSLGY